MLCLGVRFQPVYVHGHLLSPLVGTCVTSVCIACVPILPFVKRRDAFCGRGRKRGLRGIARRETAPAGLQFASKGDGGRHGLQVCPYVCVPFVCVPSSLPLCWAVL